MTAVNRSAKEVPAWAIVERSSGRLAIFSGEVPIYWLRKVAQARADEYGGDQVKVERIVIKRLKK